MPLASSYLEQNDYQPLKFSPYKLNVNDIAKTLSVKTAYWNQGAERVKNKYMDALNLDVTNPQNQQILKDYIGESEGLVKKLSSQDLGNPDVQEQGINIFKPLFSDRPIMFDDAYTKHLKKVRQDYYSLLKTDPGKASTINLMYALEDEESFRNDPQRESAEKYYNKRKEYTPYYDASSEINTVMKNCKASLIVNEQPVQGTGYSNQINNKFLSEYDVTDCFEAGLSQQARQQFNINGYMAFKNNKEALANEYMNRNALSIKRLYNKLEELGSEEATLLAKQKAGTISKDELAYLQSLGDNKKNYAAQIQNYNDINSRLVKKDFTDLDRDYETIAGSIFTDMKLSKFGQAFSYNEFSNKFVSDPVGMLKIRQEFESHQNDLDRMTTLKVQEMKNDSDYALTMLKQLNGEDGKGGASGYTGLKYKRDQFGNLIPEVKVDDMALTDKGAVPEEINFYQEFQKDVDNNTNSIKQQNSFVAKRLLADDTFLASMGGNMIMANPSYGTYKEMLTRVANGEDIDLNQFGNLLKYIGKNAKNKFYGDWLTVNMGLQTEKNTLNEKTKAIESTIPGDLKSKSEALKLADIKPTTVNINNIPYPVTKEGMVSIIEGNSPLGLRVEVKKQRGGPGAEDEIITTRAYYLGNNQLTNPTEIKKLDELYVKVTDIEGKRVENLNKVRKEKYGEAGWRDMNFYSINSADKSGNFITLKTRLDNLKPKLDEKTEPQVLSTDYQGGVKVLLPGYSGDIDTIQEYIGGLMETSSGRKPEVRKLSGDTYLIQGLSNFDYSKQLGLNQGIFKIGMNLMAASRNLAMGDSRKTSIPIIFNGVSENYTIETIKTPTGVSFEIQDPRGNTIQNFDDAFAAMKYIQETQTTLR